MPVGQARKLILKCGYSTVLLHPAIPKYIFTVDTENKQLGRWRMGERGFSLGCGEGVVMVQPQSSSLTLWARIALPCVGLSYN